MKSISKIIIIYIIKILLLIFKIINIIFFILKIFTYLVINKTLKIIYIYYFFF